MDRETTIFVALNLLQKFKNDLDMQERQMEDIKNNCLMLNESSSDSDDDLVVAAGKEHKPDRRRIVKITNYIDSVVAFYDEQSFQENFRLTRPAYECVLREITLIWNEDPNGRMKTKINTQLLAVIWLLATPDSYRSVSERFNLSKGHLSFCFVRVINALNELAPKYIKWPTDRELLETKSKFGSKSPFKDLIGVIDGTYVPIKAPKNQVRSYTNRKGFTSMTLQCICDSEMKYIDCYTGWPSSVPDIRVFKNSDIFSKCQQYEWDFFPNSEYILGDKAYPCLSWCIPPYIARRQLTRAETEFNKKHSSTRVIIENSFALLFGRFRRLRDLDMNRIDWIPSTILACCVLHNICLGFDDSRNEDFMSEGRANVARIDINQDSGDFESGNVDGTAKRNRLRNEILNN